MVWEFCISTTHVVPSNSSRMKGRRGGGREEKGEGGERNGARGSRGGEKGGGGGEENGEKGRGGRSIKRAWHVRLQGRCVSKVM